MHASLDLTGEARRLVKTFCVVRTPGNASLGAQSPWHRLSEGRASKACHGGLHYRCR